MRITRLTRAAKRALNFDEFINHIRGDSNAPFKSGLSDLENPSMEDAMRALSSLPDTVTVDPRKALPHVFGAGGRLELAPGEDLPPGVLMRELANNIRESKRKGRIAPGSPMLDMMRQSNREYIAEQVIAMRQTLIVALQERLDRDLGSVGIGERLVQSRTMTWTTPLGETATYDTVDFGKTEEAVAAYLQERSEEGLEGVRDKARELLEDFQATFTTKTKQGREFLAEFQATIELDHALD